MPELTTDATHARATVFASGVMAMTAVALVLLTLLVWYPRSVS